MNRDAPKLILESGDHRIVLVNERYNIEKKDGLDAMGVQRWRSLGSCGWWEARGEEEEDFSIPRSLFRYIMTMIQRTMDRAGAPQ